jgi:hypothetical protein
MEPGPVAETSTEKIENEVDVLPTALALPITLLEPPTAKGGGIDETQTT